MHLFYHPDIEGQSEIFPDRDEIGHIRAMRLRPGSEILITDGKGGVARGIVTDSKRGLCWVLSNYEKTYTNSLGITIGIAPTKNEDRLEWFVEKAVEIGIDRIRLFTSANSERTRIRMDRLKRVSIAAIKQSRRYILPEIGEIVDFNELILQEPGSQRFIACCSEEIVRSGLREKIEPGKSTFILIGPEGDFTLDEVKSATGAGFFPVTLGKTRLRTETAGLVALQTFHFVNG